MCTFFKLFRSLLGDSDCQGKSWNMKDFHVSAFSFLSEHNISTLGSEATISDLILNKIIPDKVEVSQLNQVDILTAIEES
jgi:hypothetical protein